MCESYNILLQSFIDGELSQLELIFLEDHLSSCRDCRRELNRLKILDWDLKNQFREIQAPPELSQLREKCMDEYLTPQEMKKEKSEKGIDVWELHYRNLKKTVGFMRYLPGSKVLQNVVESQQKSFKKSLKKYRILNIIGS
ncbi:anti-sigma factor family protein [Candidatus Contubernalis alkaliaceticus]|uniref:anti-sigma factor family protein n=1 Tax=Candidatus Contubernalis alkaliaceticus TaxID=338645 RepID=UPI001F4C24A4|nr:zf-HC2 domain-containing protein [Candidatus Contubernalis alkalaceticus]UNC92913.1 zf-HC2 domain-containing protein [Candidatus Contubernalis alkalaceticus]